jgi:uncharacterized protein YneF (UPF0154 family)
LTIKKIKSKEIYENVPEVQIWLDDIEKIKFWVDEIPASSPSKIILEVGGSQYETTNIEDVATFDHYEVDTLEIAQGEGEFSVTISRAEKVNSIRYTDTTPRMNASATQIKQILIEQRRLKLIQALQGKHSRPITYLVAAVIVLLFSLLNVGLAHNSFVNVLIFVAVTLVFGLTGGIFMLALKAGESRIFTKTRAEHPTFWQRKRDDLLITIVSSVISLVVGGVIGYWVNTIS